MSHNLIFVYLLYNNIGMCDHILSLISALFVSWCCNLCSLAAFVITFLRLWRNDATFNNISQCELDLLFCFVICFEVGCEHTWSRAVRKHKHCFCKFGCNANELVIKVRFIISIECAPGRNVDLVSLVGIGPSHMFRYCSQLYHSIGQFESDILTITRISEWIFKVDILICHRQL